MSCDVGEVTERLENELVGDAADINPVVQFAPYASQHVKVDTACMIPSRSCAKSRGIGGWTHDL